MGSQTLTAAAINRAVIPDGKANITLWDAQAPGLGLRIGKRGKIWVMKLSQDGKRVTRRIGEYPAMSIADARKEVQQARSRRSEGKPVLSGPVLAGIGQSTSTGLMSVDQVWDEYLRLHVKPNLKRADRTDKDYQSKLHPLIGGAICQHLTRADVMKVLDELRKRETDSQYAKMARLLRAFLNWAGDRNYAMPAIAARIKIPSTKKRDRVLEPEEMRAWLTAADSMGIRASGVTRLLALTCCRLNEICHLTWDEVDLPNKRLTLTAERTKTDTSRIVYLSDAAVEQVERAQQISGTSKYVFPSLRLKKDAPYDGSNLAGQLRAKSGVNAHMHDVRRTVATIIASLGYSDTVVRLILGHASSQVFAGALSSYVQGDAFEKQCRAALDQVADILG